MCDSHFYLLCFSQDRASKLVGLRLEKHLDKIREQYQQQKQEEEERRQRYHTGYSPQVAHNDQPEEVENKSSSR